MRHQAVLRMTEYPRAWAAQLLTPLSLGCRLKDFKRIYEYQGEATCAADGMCQEKCPVKINTGELIKSIRAEQMKDMKQASGGAMVRVVVSGRC